MGIAIAGQIPTGIAIAGQQPAGLAIAGQNVFAGGPSLPWLLLSSVTIVSPALTSSPINTTGAKLLVVTVAYNIAAVNFQFTDSQNNIWLLGATIDGTPTAVRTDTYYCINPTTSTTHTFSNTGSALYASSYVAAFQGPTNISFDQATSTNNNNVSNYTPQLPPITPSSNNSLLVSGIGLNATASAINSGFTITGSYPFVNGVVLGGAMAYLIQAIASAVSPIWTLGAGSANYYSAAVMTSFGIPPLFKLLRSTYISTALNTPTVSSALDTTGANLIVVVTATYLASQLTDNQNNTWSLGVNAPTAGQQTFSTIWYCINPTTSASHIFSLTNSASSVLVLAFKTSGSVTVGPSSTVTDPAAPSTLTLPPIHVPPKSLVVSGIVNIQNVGTIDSGFNKVLNAPNFGTARVGAAAILITDADIPALSPTWNLTPVAYPGGSGASMLVFTGV